MRKENEKKTAAETVLARPEELLARHFNEDLADALFLH